MAASDAGIIAGSVIPSVLAALLVVLATCFCCVRKRGHLPLIKRQPGEYHEIKYELSHTALPPLKGLPLRVVSYLYTSIFGSWILVPSSLKQAGYNLMEQLVLDEPPTYQPLVPTYGPIMTETDTPVDVEKLIKSEKSDDRFRFRSISDYYHNYRDRNNPLTPTVVAENIINALKLSEASNPKLGAIVQWNKEEILKMAEASTKRFEARTRSVKPLSVMDGVPVCVKEEFSCKPYIFRVGTCYRSEKAKEDATIVAKLRKAGAIIIGISNMHELGMGTTGNNVSEHHGTARNPYNVQHYPGGSSSGSAVAVAAGLCPVSMGTDGGGSVRIPATLCGLVGLKATFGRFSLAGCAPLAFTVTHVGPLCGNVRDAAILYGLLAGPDHKDANTMLQPPITLDQFENDDLTDMKMGVYWTYFEDANEEVVSTCRDAVEFLEQKGVELKDIEIAELEEVRVAHITAILGEFRTGLRADFAENTRDLSSEDALLLSTASQFSCAGYVTANKQRTRTMQYLTEKVFSKVDVIITPATAVTAPRIDPKDLKYGLSKTALTLDIMRFVSMGNLTGIPCLVVPVGYDKQGLPIGLQIMGKWWDDEKILRIGNVLQNFTKRKEPMVYYEPLKTD